MSPLDPAAQKVLMWPKARGSPELRCEMHAREAGRRSDLGSDPLSAAALNANIPSLARHVVYLCGPPGMTDAAKQALRAAGVPRRQIHHESFEF